MKRAITRTSLADRDLLEIGIRLAEKNVATADKFLDQLETVSQLLSQFPYLGTACDELHAGYRYIRLRGFPYLLFYRAEPDRVLITRVLHRAMDLPSALRE